jgi:hypothetical protein
MKIKPRRRCIPGATDLNIMYKCLYIDAGSPGHFMSVTANNIQTNVQYVGATRLLKTANSLRRKFRHKLLFMNDLMSIFRGVRSAESTFFHIAKTSKLK